MKSEYNDIISRYVKIYPNLNNTQLAELIHKDGITNLGLGSLKVYVGKIVREFNEDFTDEIEDEEYDRQEEGEESCCKCKREPSKENKSGVWVDYTDKSGVVGSKFTTNTEEDEDEDEAYWDDEDEYEEDDYEPFEQLPEGTKTYNLIQVGSEIAYLIVDSVREGHSEYDNLFLFGETVLEFNDPDLEIPNQGHAIHDALLEVINKFIMREDFWNEDICINLYLSSGLDYDSRISTAVEVRHWVNKLKNYNIAINVITNNEDTISQVAVLGIDSTNCIVVENPHNVFNPLEEAYIKRSKSCIKHKSAIGFFS